MPNYRRRRIEGGQYFLTLATHQRRRILCNSLARSLLRKAIAAEQARRPFRLDAVVLLPDHVHMLLTLPYGDVDYSTRVAQIKKRFTHEWLLAGGSEGYPTASRQRQRIRGVWEKRFWEHTIADRRDFVRHLDYIHVNPVKHGLVQWPKDWPWSTFRQYVRKGTYEPDWCGNVDEPWTIYIEP